MSEKRGLLIALVITLTAILAILVVTALAALTVHQKIQSESAISLVEMVGKLEKEANLKRGGIDYSDYLSFLLRLKNNPQLMEALRKAKDKEVIVHVSSHFSIGAGCVWIDKSASDEKIIEFLLGTPAEKPTEH